MSKRLCSFPSVISVRWSVRNSWYNLNITVMKTAVIGSGAAGLAVACRLASRGVKVDLFEKNSTPGGKISEIRDKGYRFDTGPSLFTLPSMVTDIAGLDYFELENSCRYFFPDGTEFNFYNDQQRLKEECESTGVREFGNIAARL